MYGHFSLVFGDIDQGLSILSSDEYLIMRSCEGSLGDGIEHLSSTIPSLPANLSTHPTQAMSTEAEPQYLLKESNREVERLQKQHAWFQRCLNNQMVFAPVDLNKEELKVLDVGCADGEMSF